MTTSDRIEKTIVLRAPRARVWRAIADAREFGAWFRLAIEGAFAPGARVKARVTYPGFEHLGAEMHVERMDEGQLFSYRWHPAAVDPKVDYSQEPMTLVEFRLEDADGGTKLTVTESGFDKIPLARRAEAFRMNDGGWSQQMTNIEQHVAPA